MRSFSTLHILLLLIISIIQLVSINAQFGMKKNIEKGIPMSKPDNGDELGVDINQKEGFLSEQDAADMSAIIEEATKDLETMAMITKLKSENKEALEELKKLSPEEVIGGMKETLDNLKLIEYLFKDPKRAVKEMEKEGMIEKAHIKKYRKDPALLEADTRKGLYFNFISLAVVGGFIDE